MVPGVLYRVIYGTPTPAPWQKSLTTLRPALLPNHRRHRVKHAQYPAIIPCEGASVRGAMCTGLTDGDLWRLDIFEGEDYVKREVRVKVLKGADVIGGEGNGTVEEKEVVVEEEREVMVYVWIGGEERLEAEEWDFEDFRRTKMRRWIGGGDGDGSEEEEVDEGFGDVRRAEAEGLEEGEKGRSGNGNGSLITANEINARAGS